MTADSNLSNPDRLGIFKLSFPYVRSVLFKNWRVIVLLFIISVLLGFVPTIKSELEAGLIDEISRTIQSQGGPEQSIGPSPNPNSSPRPFSEAVADVLSSEMSRFNRTRPDEGIPERLASLFFGDLPIGVALLVFLGLSLVAYGVELFTTILQTRVSREVFTKLRSIGLTKGLITDPSQLPALNNVAGQYSNAIQVGAANVGNTYGYLLDGGQHFISLGTALILVFTTSWRFALACLFIVSLQVWLSRIQGRRLRRRRNELDARRNDLLGRTDDVLSKREIILAYERQQDYQAKLERYTRNYADVIRTVSIREKLFSLSSRLITDYGRMLILLVGLLVTLGIARTSSGVSGIGDAYFFLSIYTRILFPATNLIRKYDSLKESESTSRTFLAVLRPQSSEIGALTPPEKSRAKSAAATDQATPGSADAITLNDVYFKYPKPEGPSRNDNSEQWVLNGVSFRVPDRKTTLVLGRSGCGKTTIARLLLGFWRPDKGSLAVFGQPISKYSGDELRSLMAYVSQGDHIVDDTVRENLGWGYTRDGRDISDEKMLQVLEELKVVRNTQERKEILDRLARDLSGGQQQRLSFARMMLDESEIMILDEPFAGVDIFTIRAIRPHLRRIFDSNDRTILMFSHRLAFAAYAEHIVIFGDTGKVIEEGPPAELLANKDSEFSKLYGEARAELSLQVG